MCQWLQQIYMNTFKTCADDTLISMSDDLRYFVIWPNDFSRSVWLAYASHRNCHIRCPCYLLDEGGLKHQGMQALQIISWAIFHNWWLWFWKWTSALLKSLHDWMTSRHKRNSAFNSFYLTHSILYGCAESLRMRIASQIFFFQKPSEPRAKPRPARPRGQTSQQ